MAHHFNTMNGDTPEGRKENLIKEMLEVYPDLTRESIEEKMRWVQECVNHPNMKRFRGK
jgi:hypothetical protein